MGATASGMAGKAKGPPYGWQKTGANQAVLDARRQELLALQVMSPDQLLEWNRLLRLSEGDTGADEPEAQFKKPVVTGADAAALVG